MKGGEKGENVEMDVKSRKAMRLIKIIKQCRELALTAQDVGEFLGGRAEVSWEHGEEDLREWSKRKGDGSASIG